MELLGEQRDLAIVDILGVRRKVDLGLLQDEHPIAGDWVLIHVGFAMSKISEADAKDQLRLLSELGEQQAAMEEVQGYGFGENEAREDSTGPPYFVGDGARGD